MSPRVMLSLCALALLTGPACGGLAKTFLRPEEPFSPQRVPAAPTYDTDRWWAALPTGTDQADRVPKGETDGQAQADVDVFFVHPTTYLSDDNWNQPLSDETANERVDEGVLRNQASAFNGAARVFAPRYRQATLFAFMETVDLASADQAVDVAFGDVEAAFDAFLVRIGDRPFIVASHSQGSYHALRLLAKRVDGTALRERLVAAYLIGIPLPLDVFERTLLHIPLCAEATQTGCVVAYNTVTRDLDDQARFRRRLPIPYPGGGYESTANKKLACVNPITWTADGSVGAKRDHLGAVKFEDDDDVPAPDKGLFGARCVEGLLILDGDLPWKYRNLLSGSGDLHLSDYQVFWMNLRRNVKDRVAAFATLPAGGTIDQ